MTDQKAILLALADRCEREEPSRELDGAVALATGWSLRKKVWWQAPGARVWEMGPSAFTESLDAATTLMLGDWGIAWDVESVFACGENGIDGVGVCAYVWLDHPTYEDTFCRSPVCRTHAEAMQHIPRLICRAALKARAAI